MTTRKPRQTKPKVQEITVSNKIEEIVEQEQLEESSDIPVHSFKQKNDKPKIYYFAVEGYVNEEGEEIKTSFPSMYNDFNCQWDRMSIIDRAALKHYLNIKGKESKDIWPLKFKFYINPKSKAVYECNIELDFAPVFTEEIKKEKKDE